MYLKKKILLHFDTDTWVVTKKCFNGEKGERCF